MLASERPLLVGVCIQYHWSVNHGLFGAATHDMNRLTRRREASSLQLCAFVHRRAGRHALDRLARAHQVIVLRDKASYVSSLLLQVMIRRNLIRPLANSCRMPLVGYNFVSTALLFEFGAAATTL